MAIEKVVKKKVIIDGKEVPYYICPSGMSGVGVDLTEHFKDKEEKGELEVTVSNKEDLGFIKEFQKYCDTGEVEDSQIEDFVMNKQTMKYYDSKTDTNIDLVDIFSE